MRKKSKNDLNKAWSWDVNVMYSTLCAAWLCSAQWQCHMLQYKLSSPNKVSVWVCVSVRRKKKFFSDCLFFMQKGYHSATGDTNNNGSTKHHGTPTLPWRWQSRVGSICLQGNSWARRFPGPPSWWPFPQRRTRKYSHPTPVEGTPKKKKIIKAK